MKPFKNGFYIIYPIFKIIFYNKSNLLLLSGHNSVKLFFRNNSIFINVCLINHFLQLRFLYVLSEVFHYLFQISNWNKTRFFLVEQTKYLTYISFSIFVWHSIRHHIQKLIELHLRNIFIQFVLNHHIQGLILWFWSKGVKRC